MTILTDDEITKLIAEEKVLPTDYPRKFKTKAKSDNKYEEQEFTVLGKGGHTFTIIFRKNKIDFLDFSIILRYMDGPTGSGYNLVRYNGKHIHTNRMEGDSFHDFHKHLATQKYQEAGQRIESYAQVMTTYKSYDEAIKAFIRDLNFSVELPESTSTLKDYGGG